MDISIASPAARSRGLVDDGRHGFELLQKPDAAEDISCAPHALRIHPRQVLLRFRAAPSQADQWPMGVQPDDTNTPRWTNRPPYDASRRGPKQTGHPPR